MSITPETISARVSEHIINSNRRHDQLEKRIDDVEDELRAELATKVSYKTFMLIFTILSGILGYMVWQMNDIREKTTSTDIHVAQIYHDVQLVPEK